jgi:hypothetical protein
LLLDVIEGGAATIKDPRVDQLEGVVDRIATEWVLDRVIVLAVFHWLSDMGLVR